MLKIENLHASIGDKEILKTSAYNRCHNTTT